MNKALVCACLSVALLVGACGQSQDEKRQHAKAYWNTVIGQMARTDVAESKAFLDDDPVEISADFKKALDEGNAAFMGAGGEIETDDAGHDFSAPDGWDDIRNHLQASIMHMQNAAKDARAALDSGKPSDVANAKDEYSQITAPLKQAYSMAKTSYASFGGNPADLSDPRPMYK